MAVSGPLVLSVIEVPIKHPNIQLQLWTGLLLFAVWVHSEALLLWVFRIVYSPDRWASFHYACLPVPHSRPHSGICIEIDSHSGPLLMLRAHLPTLALCVFTCKIWLYASLGLSLHPIYFFYPKWSDLLNYYKMCPWIWSLSPDYLFFVCFPFSLFSVCAHLSSEPSTLHPCTDQHNAASLACSLLATACRAWCSCFRVGRGAQRIPRELMWGPAKGAEGNSFQFSATSLSRPLPIPPSLSLYLYIWYSIF